MIYAADASFLESAQNGRRHRVRAALQSSIGHRQRRPTHKVHGRQMTPDLIRSPRARLSRRSVPVQTNAGPSTVNCAIIIELCDQSCRKGRLCVGESGRAATARAGPFPPGLLPLVTYRSALWMHQPRGLQYPAQKRSVEQWLSLRRTGLASSG